MTIVEYQRPKSLEEALQYLANTERITLPVGGGTTMHRLGDSPVTAVDLQALGLNQAERRGNQTILGATLTLQALSEIDVLPAALRKSAQRETSLNLRHMSTLAGTLVACDGRSPLATALLATDAQLTIVSAIHPQEEIVSLGDLLPFRQERLAHRLITQISIPANVRLEIEMIGRTPADWPFAGVALARWPSGRTRIALMGYGPQPILALDGPESGGASAAVQIAWQNASDAWASATYRQAIATTLVERILDRLADDAPAGEEGYDND